MGKSQRAATFAPFAVILLMGIAAPMASSLPAVQVGTTPHVVVPVPNEATAPAAPASAAQAAPAAPNSTVVEQGFSNVQIVWTNIGFGAPLSADEGDATGDGHPELAIGTESGVIVADKHFANIYWETKLFEPVAFVAFQDMDGELPLDVVAVTMAGHTLGLNGADGSTLWEGQVGPLQAAHLTDVTGDDVRDIVAATLAGHVSALDGKTGAQLWQSSITDASQFAVNRIRTRGILASAVGDLNGDGTPDVAVGDKTYKGGIGGPSTTYATIYAYDGKSGSPLFTTNLHPQEPGSYLTVRGVAIGDVNGDGANDVVVGGEYENTILKNYFGYCNQFVCLPTTLPPETPRFLGGFVTALDASVAVQGTTPVHQAAAPQLWNYDFNKAKVSAVGFAGAQLLAGTTYGQVIAMENGAPSGTPVNVSHEQHPARIKDIRSLPKGDALVVTDFFFVRMGAGPASKAVFDPPGFFTPVSMTTVGDEASFLATVEDARVYHLTPDFAVEATTKTYGKGNTMATADYTGDGVVDLVMGSLDGDAYLLNGRTGRRLANGTAPGPIVADLGLGKVNGDAKPDVLAATTGGDVVALDGRDFAKLWSLHVGDNVIASRAGDLTADGTTDLAVLTRGGTVAVVNGQSGQIAWNYEPPAETKVTSIAVADFDGDGDADLAVGHNKEGELVALDGQTKSALWSAKGGQPAKAVKGADLNGDGRAEIVAVLDRASQGGSPKVKAFDKGAPLWNVDVAEAGFILGLGLATGRIDATSKGADVLVCLSGEAYSDPNVKRTGPAPPPVHKAFGIHGEMGHLFWTATLPQACGPSAVGDLNRDGWSEAILSYGAGIAALDGETGALVMNYATNGRNRELLAVRLNDDKVPEILLASEDANTYALAFSEGAVFGDAGGGGDGTPTVVQPKDFFGPAKRSKKGFLPGFEAVLVAAALLALAGVRRRAA